ncbi:hypothetical protein [Robinsoniella sp. KNHs210]|uniref:hypothetical protein n=1 Tax=Robinsoniella sp. KNHs210 TaxID=1469950 RepID=UPI000482995F|nr:hypothetical protein [Robinsoniella sp. KNHs210]
MQRNGVDYRALEITGIDEYQNDYEAYALPEFKGDAYSDFVNMVKEADTVEGGIRVVLDGEKTIKKQPVEFIFNVRMPEDAFDMTQLLYAGVSE